MKPSSLNLNELEAQFRATYSAFTPEYLTEWFAAKEETQAMEALLQGKSFNLTATRPRVRDFDSDAVSAEDGLRYAIAA